MPHNSNLAFAIALWDAYVSQGEREIHIAGFTDLCKAVGASDALAALKSVRDSGGLTEGAHSLPSPVSDFLISLGASPLVIRSWPFGQRTPSCSTHPLPLVSQVLSQAKAEEVEAWDSSEQWYLRFRDDDPLFFLAMPRPDIEQLVRLFPDNCREIARDFVFAA
jgi:hypothetical protein